MFRGVVGILIGAALYSEVYPLIQGNVLKMGVYGKLTLPELLGAPNPWLVIVPLVALLGGFLLWTDRKGF